MASSSSSSSNNDFTSNNKVINEVINVTSSDFGGRPRASSMETIVPSDFSISSDEHDTAFSPYIGGDLQHGNTAGAFMVVVTKEAITKNKLVLPHDHCQRYMHDLLNIIFTLHVDDEDFTTKLNFKDGLYVFGRGWKRFASENSLNTGDQVLFVSKGCSRLHFDVTILHNHN